MAGTPFKVIKLRRGTTLQHETFIGAQGEITVDTDKKTVVVHDGFTTGGFPLKLETKTYIRQRYMTFRAAAVQHGSAALGFSCGSNGPQPIAITPPEWVGAIVGAASFASGVIQTVQEHLMIPANFVGPLDLEIIWRCYDTTGNVSWQIETSGASHNSPLEGLSFIAQSIQAPVSPVVLGLVTTTIPNLNTSGLMHGEEGELFFRFSRLRDFVFVPAELISLRFILNVSEN